MTKDKELNDQMQFDWGCLAAKDIEPLSDCGGGIAGNWRFSHLMYIWIT
jgi:hypothetical protein